MDPNPLDSSPNPPLHNPPQPPSTSWDPATLALKKAMDAARSTDDSPPHFTQGSTGDLTNELETLAETLTVGVPRRKALIIALRNPPHSLSLSSLAILSQLHVTTVHGIVKAHKPTDTNPT